MSEARISVLDYGFLHSDATYDVVHVWKGAFFRLDAHIDRFLNGLDKLHMSIPYSPEQIERGLHGAISDVVRIPPPSVDPTIKNYHWLDLITGLFNAYDKGAETVILKDASGNLAEGPGFNLFVVRNGHVTTPDYGVLLGITRQTIFDLCALHQIPCSPAAVSAEALRSADEAFITSTAGGAMPLTRVNGDPIGSGTIGPLTQQLMEAYWTSHANDALRSVVSYPDPK